MAAIQHVILAKPTTCNWCSVLMGRGARAFMVAGKRYCSLTDALEDKREERKFQAPPLPTRTATILDLMASEEYGVREAIAATK